MKAPPMGYRTSQSFVESLERRMLLAAERLLGESSFALSLIEHDGTLLFHAFAGEQRAWWKSDGTAAGTAPFLPPSPSVLDALDVNGTLYFIDDTGKLGKIDGTAAGTSEIAQVL